MTGVTVYPLSILQVQDSNYVMALCSLCYKSLKILVLHSLFKRVDIDRNQKILKQE